MTIADRHCNQERTTMIAIRPAQERGAANFGWLDTRHTFSFGSYYDPNYLGFASLRVINEDRVQPSKGFATHAHRDMEIITYVLEGALEHKDSLGNGSIIRPGDVQRMSAGTGIQHSEFNPSPTEPVHLLQIWILPQQTGIEPSYEQKYFAEAEKQGKLRLIGSRDRRQGAVTIHQDVELYATCLASGEEVGYILAAGRSAWIQVARGSVLMNGHSLKAGDGVALSQPAAITLKGISAAAEVLLFDMAN